MSAPSASAPIPAIRNRQAVYHLAEATSSYTAPSSNLCPGIIETLESMTKPEQKRLDALLKREGIHGFLKRLGIAEEDA